MYTGYNAIITTLYVRLADWCPLLKLELFECHTESEIKLLATILQITVSKDTHIRLNYLMIDIR